MDQSPVSSLAGFRWGWRVRGAGGPLSEAGPGPPALPSDTWSSLHSAWGRGLRQSRTLFKECLAKSLPHKPPTPGSVPKSGGDRASLPLTSTNCIQGPPGTVAQGEAAAGKESRRRVRGYSGPSVDRRTSSSPPHGFLKPTSFLLMMFSLNCSQIAPFKRAICFLPDSDG